MERFFVVNDIRAYGQENCFVVAEVLCIVTQTAELRSLKETVPMATANVTPDDDGSWNVRHDAALQRSLESRAALRRSLSARRSQSFDTRRPQSFDTRRSQSFDTRLMYFISGMGTSR